MGAGGGAAAAAARSAASRAAASRAWFAAKLLSSSAGDGTCAAGAGLKTLKHAARMGAEVGFFSLRGSPRTR